MDDSDYGVSGLRPPLSPLSLPVVGGGGELAGVGHGAAREALERRRGGVDTQRHSVRVQLFLNEFVETFLDLGHAGQLDLPHVVEDLLGGGLEVPGVLPHALGGGDATGTHAAVVAKATLVKIRMVQSLANTDPLLGVQGEHLAQKVDGLVGSGGSQRVEGGHGRRLAASGQHVTLGGLAGVLHVGQRGRPQQVRDQLQLLDGRRGLK